MSDAAVRPLYPHEIAMLTELDEEHWRSTLAVSHHMSGDSIAQRVAKASIAFRRLAARGLVERELAPGRALWRRTPAGTAALLAAVREHAA